VFPGAVLELRDDEAMVLVQDGIAVPVTAADSFARETRAYVNRDLAAWREGVTTRRVNLE
jgi:hypothetical protein